MGAVSLATLGEPSAHSACGSRALANADIKKAIACLLVGGSRRVLPDGMRLRGDINVLLLGDPSTAKSQFLKFVEKVAPVGVYTSGKGSSAAGLTASVTRDSRVSGAPQHSAWSAGARDPSSDPPCVFVRDGESWCRSGRVLPGGWRHGAGRRWCRLH